MFRNVLLIWLKLIVVTNFPKSLWATFFVMSRRNFLWITWAPATEILRVTCWFLFCSGLQHWYNLSSPRFFRKKKLNFTIFLRVENCFIWETGNSRRNLLCGLHLVSNSPWFNWRRRSKSFFHPCHALPSLEWWSQPGHEERLQSVV